MVVNVFFSAVTQATMSRHELLAWVNDCLQSQMTKIEEMSTGAAYCGLTDYLFPGNLPIKKVKWNGKSEVDYINNWNILQKAWKDIGIDKPVPVERLLKAKFQENFEFLQWFKKFFDANWEDHDYDTLGARNGEEFPAALPGGAKRPAPPRVSAPKPTQPPAARAPRPAAAPAAAAATKPAPSTRMSVGAKAMPPKAGATPPTTAPASNGSAAAIAAAVASVEAKFRVQVEELLAENQQLAETTAGMEKERDFYFSKLRAIEILCTDLGEGIDPNIDRITQILYETDGGESVEGAESPESAANLTTDVIASALDDIVIPEVASPLDPHHGHHDENGTKEHVHNGTDHLVSEAAKIDLNDSDTF